jgi:hypothetical protein
MRELTIEEKNISLKNKNALEKRNEHLKIEIDYENWLLFKDGLKMNFEKQFEEHRILLREKQNEKKENEIIINQIRDMIERGVEIKEGEKR